MKSPLMKCPRCNGTGKSHLDAAIDETLQLLSGEWESTGLIFDHLDNPHIGQTAISNRLAKLKELGLVDMELRGKSKYWKRK